MINRPEKWAFDVRMSVQIAKKHGMLLICDYLFEVALQLNRMMKENRSAFPRLLIDLSSRNYAACVNSQHTLTKVTKSNSKNNA